MKKINLIVMAMICVIICFCSACGKTSSTPATETSTPVASEESIEVAKSETDAKYQVNEDGKRHVVTPTLELEYIGDSVANNYNFATLNAIILNDTALEAEVATDMPIIDIIYEIYSADDELLYQGANRLSYGKTTDDVYHITINTAEDAEEIDVVDGVISNNLNYLKDDTLPIKIRMRSGKDSEIIISLR